MPVIPVKFVTWYKFSSPYLLRNTSRKAMYFSLLRPLVPSMIARHRMNCERNSYVIRARQNTPIKKNSVVLIRFILLSC